METWWKETVELLADIFVQKTPGETQAVVVLSYLAGWFVLGLIGRHYGLRHSIYLTAPLLLPIGVILLAGTAVLPAHFGYESVLMNRAAFALALLVVVVPLTMLFHGEHYSSALVAWAATILTIWAVLLAEPPARKYVEHYKGMLMDGKPLYEPREKRKLE